MTLTERSVSALLAAFRSSEPTPGGGSAAALAGAVGASLLRMVAALPKPRAGTDEDVRRLAAAGTRCEAAALELEALVDRDSGAYEQVMSAYRLPKGTDEEKASRSARIQAALKIATDTPLAVMRTCRDAIEHGAVVAALGNRNAASDVHVGLELLGAGLRGAQLNVEINLGSVKDAAYVEQVRSDVAQLARQSASSIAAARARLDEPA